MITRNRSLLALVLFVFSFPSAGAQELKVWVFFKDKGFSSQDQAERALKEREKELGPRTLWRRSKVRKPPLTDMRDLPVYGAYKEKIRAICPKVRAESRVLNAISVAAKTKDLKKIKALDFVASVKRVRAYNRSRAQPAPLVSKKLPGKSFLGLNYGQSFYQLDQINVVALHNMGFTGKGVIVCMMDTGYYKDHEAFANLDVIGEWDFINKDGNTQNEPGDPPGQHDHGTLTWSALGGKKDGELYGPAHGASFLLAKTEDISQEVPIEEDWWTEGIEWAENKGADVASSSLVYDDWYNYSDMDGKTAVVTKAANWAVEQGVCVVNAMGNEGHFPGAIGAPADSDGVISCGAVDSFGVIASFSSTGPTYDGRIKPDVCARGVSTWCATAYGVSDYGFASGTSLSTPLVGGCVALILEAHPHYTPADVKQVLHDTGDNAALPNNLYGWGIANALDAVMQKGVYPLEQDQFFLSESTGGQIKLSLNSGASYKNRTYLIFSGITGFSPGFALPGGMAVMPINWDLFTTIALNLTNTPIFQNFYGTLDNMGMGAADFHTLGPATGGAGISLYFAYGLDNPWDFASNPVRVSIIP